MEKARINRCSSPSELRITDMRFVDLVGAPMHCTLVKIYTNQGITDVITHITELNYCYSGGCFIAGSPFWDKLSDEDKAIFAECAQLASDEFTTFFREKTESMTQEGLESGQWTVDQPSDDMKAAMQEISEEIWEESREKYGDEIMDVIISGEYRTLSES